MNYDEMLAQGTDWNKKYCYQHDRFYEINCPDCNEQERDNDDEFLR